MGLLAAAARLPRSPLMCALLHRAQHTLSLSMIRQVSGVHAGAGAALARPAAAPTLPAAAPARAVRSYAARRMQLGSPYRKGLNMKRLEQGRKPVLKQVEVDVGSEGFEESQELQLLLEQLEEDGKAVVREAMKLKVAANPRYKLPQVANLSLVLCDDATIQGMNKEHRGKDEPTDVLSFEIQDDYDGKIALPVKLLGDLVISIDTAARQAEERQHDLLDELRVLLVHGVLHLCGYDHEAGPQQARAMSQAEAAVMAACGWDSDGLISASERSAANDSDGYEDDDDGGGNVDPSPASRPSAPASTSSSSSSGSGAAKAQQFVFRSSSVRLVALDMDGTLLDSKGRIRPSAVAAIKAACAQGTQVVLATGKARPAALKACTLAGLAGDGLVISPRRPGVFLQGLAVHGSAGQQLSDAQLPPGVVRAAFEYAAAQEGMSLCGFLGDECVTMRMTPFLEQLSTRYYEPVPHVAPSIEALLAGPPVKKLLFMSTVQEVDGSIRPHWARLLTEGGLQASLVQAVSDMLELVPLGVNKWAGLRTLLAHLDIPPDEVMAVGDGGNDLEMVSGVGIGVAMGNAVAGVKAAASVTVGSHDEDGIAEAFERFVL